jgi:hypothetical protein
MFFTLDCSSAPLEMRKTFLTVATLVARNVKEAVVARKDGVWRNLFLAEVWNLESSVMRSVVLVQLAEI